MKVKTSSILSDKTVNFGLHCQQHFESPVRDVATLEPLEDGFESVLAKLNGNVQYIENNIDKPLNTHIDVTDDFLEPSIPQEVFQTAMNSKRPLGGYLSFEGEYTGDLELQKVTRSIVTELVKTNKIRTDGQHGVMVWCLAADEGNEVTYHIDYPELVRYETNILYPPSYGLVFHCTDENQMDGGDFFANQGGLEHYKQHGFKARLKELDPSEPGWIEVKYKRNRMVVYDGRLPHFSTPVTRLAPGCKRVIWAGNVYGPQVGPQVAQRPDHSESFVRVVNLYQKLGNKLLARRCKAQEHSDKENMNLL